MIHDSSQIMNCKDPTMEERLLLCARSLMFEILCGEIQTILKSASIPFLVLKGPHVANSLYKNPVERSFCDLDILVEPKNYFPAARLFLRNSFQLSTINCRRLASVNADYQLPLRSTSGVLVELHRALDDSSQFRSDVQGIFARAEEFNFGKLKAFGLGTEDLLLHLCLHLGKRHFSHGGRKHLIDISLLLKNKIVDWTVFLSRVKYSGCRIVTFYSLEAVRMQHDADIPSVIRTSLIPNYWRRRILDHFLNPTELPIYRFQDSNQGWRERFVNLLLIDKISIMINSTFHFFSRSLLDFLLRATPIRQLWMKHHPLNEWMATK